MVALQFLINIHSILGALQPHPTYSSRRATLAIRLFSLITPPTSFIHTEYTFIYNTFTQYLLYIFYIGSKYYNIDRDVKPVKQNVCISALRW